MVRNFKIMIPKTSLHIEVRSNPRQCNIVLQEGVEKEDQTSVVDNNTTIVSSDNTTMSRLEVTPTHFGV